MAVRFGEIPFQASDGRWYWNWTDPDGIAWPKGPFETKELALGDIDKSKARAAETTMTIPQPGWNNANDLDRMLAVINPKRVKPDAVDRVDMIIEAVGSDPGATYSTRFDAGIDAEHDYTTGLIELSLAELQAFRAILALRRGA
jgi:hypothetical protein